MQLFNSKILPADRTNINVLSACYTLYKRAITQSRNGRDIYFNLSEKRHVNPVVKTFISFEPRTPALSIAFRNQPPRKGIVSRKHVTHIFFYP